VWSAELLPGQIQASMNILFLSLWIKESLNTIVSLEALKGTWEPWPEVVFCESRALTHSLRARSDLLISAPSYYLSLLLL